MDSIFYPNRMIRADFPKLRSYFLECSSNESMTENIFAFAIIIQSMHKYKFETRNAFALGKVYKPVPTFLHVPLHRSKNNSHTVQNPLTVCIIHI